MTVCLVVAVWFLLFVLIMCGFTIARVVAERDAVARRALGLSAEVERQRRVIGELLANEVTR